MATTEYKTVIVERPPGFYVRYKPPDLPGVLNREAQDGWRLVQAIPASTWLGLSWDTFLLIFQREPT
jgi:hypothetical protein